jgi:hypothetical protein
MKNGKKKMSWGTSAEDAFETLRMRLGDKAMSDIDPSDYVRLNHQREMHQYIDQLG